MLTNPMLTQDWSEIAHALAGACARISKTETLSLHGARGRILAESLLAAKPLPAITHAVMDGYALGSSSPGHYRLIDEPCDVLGMDEAAIVVAGGSVPQGTASVVLARHAWVSDHRVNVSKSLNKDNIRRIGEEAKQGDQLLTENTRLDARHVALASSAGIDAIVVRQRPRIALVGLHETMGSFPHKGIMQAMLNSPALLTTVAGVVRRMHLQETLKKLASHHDLVVVVAESLEAEAGPLATGILTLGGKTKLYRAALKPAKPIVTGRINNAYILGLAGTAYATTAAAHLFLQPMLMQMLGLPAEDDSLPVEAAFSRNRETGRAEVLPAKLILQNGRMTAALSGRFGQLRALAEMDGFALISATSGDISEGMPLQFKKLSFPLV